MEWKMRNKRLGGWFAPILFLLLLWMAIGYGVAYGAAPIATDQTMTLDGKPLKSDVPVYVESDRALVPARVIFESAGGEVGWDGDAQKVTIVYHGSKVELTIDSTTVYVDGKAEKLDVPARLVILDKKTGASRTMIPVRFVSESLGFGVEYDNDKRVISLTSPVKGDVTPQYGKISSVDCVRDNNSRVITVKATAPMGSYSDFKLTNPTRYAVDIKNSTVQAGIPESIPVADNLSPITAVRIGQFGEDTVRVAIDLTNNVNPTVELSKDKLTLTVRVPDIEPGGQIDPGVPGNPGTVNPVSKKPASLGEVLIVIDPGHGGPYPGSVASQNGKKVLYEKDPNLDIALRLNQKLQAAGLKTVMTHETDSLCDKNATSSAIDLISRSTFANDRKATLFISIHNNSADNVPNAKGTETLYNETDGKAAYGLSSKDLATLVQKKMVAYCGTANRGTKSRPDLSVLRRTEMPAIIVEGAFMSNASDLNLLLSDAFRENYAQAVADATIEYLNSIFK